MPTNCRTRGQSGAETWTYGYDADSNPTTETTPRGLHTTSTTYDSLGRPLRVSDNPASGVARATTMAYDRAGNVTQITAPGAATTENGTPQDRVTTISYDGRDLEWQRTVGAGSANARTTVTEYDSAGNLVREVKPRGVATTGLPAHQWNPDSQVAAEADAAAQNATVHTYNADNQRRHTYLPQAETADTQYRQSVIYEPRGFVESIDHAYDYQAPGTTDAGKTTRASYKYFLNGWIESTADTREVNPNNPGTLRDRDVVYDYDERGVQTLWQTDGYENGSVGGRRITRQIYPSGLLQERVGRKPLATGEISLRRYTYSYNKNRSLTRIEDHLPPQVGLGATRITAITRDRAERETLVNEQWASGRDTSFAYDRDGNVSTQTVGQRRTEFGYDNAGREEVMRVYEGSATTPLRTSTKPESTKAPG